MDEGLIVVMTTHYSLSLAAANDKLRGTVESMTTTKDASGFLLPSSSLVRISSLIPLVTDPCMLDGRDSGLPLSTSTEVITLTSGAFTHQWEHLYNHPLP